MSPSPPSAPASGAPGGSASRVPGSQTISGSHGPRSRTRRSTRPNRIRHVGPHHVPAIVGSSSRTGTTSPANPHVLLRFAPVRVRQLLSRSCVCQCPPSRWAPPRVWGPGRVPGWEWRILATCQVPPSAGRHGRISTIPLPHHPRSRSCRCRAAIPVQSGNAYRFARAHVVSQGVAVRMADWASARHHRAVSGRRAGTRPGTSSAGSASAAVISRGRRRGSRHRSVWAGEPGVELTEAATRRARGRARRADRGRRRGDPGRAKSFMLRIIGNASSRRSGVPTPARAIHSRWAAPPLLCTGGSIRQVLGESLPVNPDATDTADQDRLRSPGHRIP